MDKDTRKDFILLTIMLVVIIGTFVLLVSDIAVPSWLVGTIGTLASGIVGIQIKGNEDGNR